MKPKPDSLKLRFAAGRARLWRVCLSVSALSAIFWESAAHAQGVPGEGADVGLGAFGLVVLLALLASALAGFSLLWRGLFPRRVEWTSEITRRMPWGSFFFGLIVSIVVLLIVAVLGNAGGAGGLFALIILATFLLLFAGLGIASVVEWVGEMIDPSAAGIRRAVLGSGAWILLVLIPILGWALMGGLLFMGVGAALVSYIPTRPAAEPAPGPPPEIPEPPSE